MELEFSYPSHYFRTNSETCFYFWELIAKLGFGCTLPEVSQHFYRKQHSTYIHIQYMNDSLYHFQQVGKYDIHYIGICFRYLDANKHTAFTHYLRHGIR